MEQTLNQAIAQYVTLVVGDYQKRQAETAKLAEYRDNAHMQQYFADSARNFAESARLDVGKRFIKFVVNGGVHSFIEKATGDLYKAASWNAPAKGARFNLLTDMDILKIRVDWAGSYLYK